MPALAGYLTQAGSVFAGLAAIVIVGLRGADASRMHAFSWRFNAHCSSNLSGRAATAAQQINDQNHECDNQQQMNQTSGQVEAETQEPQDQKNRHDRLIQSYCHNHREVPARLQSP